MFGCTGIDFIKIDMCTVCTYSVLYALSMGPNEVASESQEARGRICGRRDRVGRRTCNNSDR